MKSSLLRPSIVQPQPFSLPPIGKHLVSMAIAVGGWLIDICTRDPNEISIWTRQDAQGQTQWYIYDPIFSVSFTTFSEDDVRVYVENRYYR